MTAQVMAAVMLIVQDCYLFHVRPRNPHGRQRRRRKEWPRFVARSDRDRARGSTRPAWPSARGDLLLLLRQGQSEVRALIAGSPDPLYSYAMNVLPSARKSSRIEALLERTA